MNTDYTITSDRRRLDLAAIHSFLSSAYWSTGVPMSVVEKAVANSVSFGVFFGEQQVGFARVVTDKATFAYLADVFIVEAHRGKGLAKRLLREIEVHEDLQGLRRFLLATRDAHGLYAQFGFKALANPTRMMEKWNPDIYKPAS
jgi:GNAT superfamily N-acetyltransferase